MARCFLMKLSDFSEVELVEFYNNEKKVFDTYCDEQLTLNMARGKPSPEQLSIASDLLSLTAEQTGVCAEDGTDCRNYGALAGIPECRRLFGEIFGVPAENVIACGSSSLNLMFDYVAQGAVHGFEGQTPWMNCPGRKFIAVVPGYDRHFAVAQHFGFELVSVPMRSNGPDMDMIEELVKDPDVKGMFCVPKYSNPDGVTYSDEVVERLAAMKTAAPDFRVIWDEAYIVHDFYEDDRDELANVFDIAKKYGTEDRFIAFTSTSKISLAGAGVSAIAASDANIKSILARMTIQIISYDKMNQLRHCYLFRSMDDITERMKKQAAFLRPKFKKVLDVFDQRLSGLGIAEWSKPKGGYFISLDVNTGSAKRVGELCKQCGLTLTPVGATFPYGKDPSDRNIRIAPSFPSEEEIGKAAEIVSCAVRLAAAETLMNN